MAYRGGGRGGYRGGGRGGYRGGGRGGYRGGYQGGHGGYQRGRGGYNPSRMVLMETSAPPESTLDLQQIPRDLMWKFVSNRDPDAPRYWVKLSNEERYRPRPGRGIRETCAAKHQDNFSQLRGALVTLLKTSLTKAVGQGFTLKCEARLGRLALRNGGELYHLSEVIDHRGQEFYTRTTTVTQTMVERLQTMSKMDGDPTEDVGLHVTVQAGFEKSEYKVFLDENPYGTFTLNFDEGCEYYEKIESSKADFVCIGRSHDVRIATDSKQREKKLTELPSDAKRDIQTIADSVKRTDTGNLRMILKHGCVRVEHIRQKKKYDFTTNIGNHVISLYELKESNVRPLHIVVDQEVELEQNDNQEIEVKLADKEVDDPSAIDETIREVSGLVDLAMDVVDMAEECKDPVILY